MDCETLQLVNKTLMELNEKEAQTKKSLESVRAERRLVIENAIIKCKETIERQHRELANLQQHLLHADFCEGDKSVVLDPSAGNGAGGYKRVKSDDYNERHEAFVIRQAGEHKSVRNVAGDQYQAFTGREDLR